MYGLRLYHLDGTEELRGDFCTYEGAWNEGWDNYSRLMVDDFDVMQIS